MANKREQPIEIVDAMINCFPADPALMEKVNASLPPDQQWRPSIEHTITQCDKCGRDCWIGPKQKIMATLSGIPKQCTLCILHQGDALGVHQYDLVGLNPDEDKIPRRT